MRFHPAEERTSQVDRAIFYGSQRAGNAASAPECHPSILFIISSDAANIRDNRAFDR
jgi:hypothetical protein